MRVRRLTAAVAAGLLVGAGASTASATGSALLGAADEATYAPLDQKGPALSVPSAALEQSLECSGPLTKAERDPVLLVPGTTLTPEANFSWNYLRALDTLGWAYCTVTLPLDATGDIQVAGEYVVHALRTMSKAAGRQVDVLGYSQGGMVPRWALRFWPDTRPLVDDLVGLSPSNHGTATAVPGCETGPCVPAYHQQRWDSQFTEALNSRAETFGGIDYTVVYTHADEIVFPNLGPQASSVLTTGDGTIVNVATQDVCPTNTADHFALGSYDPVGYALAVDALANPGPAVPERVQPTVCLDAVQPGVEEATFAADYAAYVAYAGDGAGNAERVPAEPALAPYVLPRKG